MVSTVFAETTHLVCCSRRSAVESQDRLVTLTSDGRSQIVFTCNARGHAVDYIVDSRGCVLLLEAIQNEADARNTRLRLLSFGTSTKTRDLVCSRDDMDSWVRVEITQFY